MYQILTYHMREQSKTDKSSKKANDQLLSSKTFSQDFRKRTKTKNSLVSFWVLVFRLVSNPISNIRSLTVFIIPSCSSLLRISISKIQLLNSSPSFQLVDFYHSMLVVLVIL